MCLSICQCINISIGAGNCWIIISVWPKDYIVVRSVSHGSRVSNIAGDCVTYLYVYSRNVNINCINWAWSYFWINRTTQNLIRRTEIPINLIVTDRLFYVNKPLQRANKTRKCLPFIRTLCFFLLFGGDWCSGFL